MVSILDPQSIYLSVRGYALQIRANEILEEYNIKICFNSLVTLYKPDTKGKGKTIGNHFQLHCDFSVSNQDKTVSLYTFTNHSQRSASVFESLDSFFEIISDNST